ncbi:MAG TPA: ParB/RepB/Spo0J family partition protein [Gammaproteobacteria bacterium]|nr:ParB/RepB/Spo0J family partition protein [Gammaproteobacteria bacterium]
MAKKMRGLGRGLDALLGSTPMATEADASSATPESADLKDLPVDLIQRGKYQPRTEINQEALVELANSIKAQGIVQPIVVRPIGSGRYEIIAGERRWRATQLADLDTIPAIIRDIADENAIAMSLIENIQREELNPMEEANALQRLIDEFELTHQQAAEAVGRSRVAVSNLLRLLSLSEEVKRMLINGDLEMGHARALLALESARQIQVAHEVASKGLSVRETERLVKRFLQGMNQAKAKPVTMDPDVLKLQNSLSEKLSAKVTIQHKETGKGKLEIQYNSLDELDGILAHIK